MPNQKTYGRRPNARARKAAACFLPSSSPVKNVNTTRSEHEVEVDTGTVVDQAVIGDGKSPEKEGRNIVFGSREGVEGVVESLARVDIQDEREKPDGRLDGGDEIKLEVLAMRDVNRVPRLKPRKKPTGAKETFEELGRENTDTHSNRTSKTKVDLRSEDSTTALSPDSSRTTAQISTQSLPPQRQSRRTQRSHGKPIPTPPLACPGPPPHIVAYTQPLLNLSNDTQNRTSPRSFHTWAEDLSRYFTVSKIAEASYGEVYRLSLLSSRSGLSKGDESVLKIVALKPPPAPQPSLTYSAPLADLAPNAQPHAQNRATTKETKKTAFMSSIPSVLSEIRLLQHMSPIPGFTNFRDVTVLQGRLPHQFVTAWRKYDRGVKKSLFPDPGRKGSYGEEQLWAVVEMQDAGTDLETLIERGWAVQEGVGGGEEAGETRDNDVIKRGNGVEVLGSVEAVWDIFWGVACAVAKGEEWAEFEHRDLHLGNICIQRAPDSSRLRSRNPTSTLNRPLCKLGFTNLETTIIDYTLSRASLGINDSTNDNDNNDGGGDGEDIAFFDLGSDPAIFQGDASETYQYEIYRVMRSAVLCDDPTFLSTAIATLGASYRSLPLSPLSANTTITITDNNNDKQSTSTISSAHHANPKHQHLTPAPSTSPLNKNPKKPKPKSQKDKIKIATKAEAVAEARTRKRQQQQETETKAWRKYHPLTNLIWLHFVLGELVKLPRVKEELEDVSAVVAAERRNGNGDMNVDVVEGWDEEADENEDDRVEQGWSTRSLARKLLLLKDLLRLEAMCDGKREAKKAHDAYSTRSPTTHLNLKTKNKDSNTNTNTNANAANAINGTNTTAQEAAQEQEQEAEADAETDSDDDTSRFRSRARARSSFTSAKDLILWVVEVGWLDEADVVGVGVGV